MFGVFFQGTQSVPASLCLDETVVFGPVAISADTEI